MQVVSRPVVAALATAGALLLGSACGSQTADDAAAAPSDPSAAASVAAAPEESTGSSPSGSPSASPSASPSSSASASAPASASPAQKSPKAGTREDSSAGGTQPAGETQRKPSAPSFPVPVEVGNATQVITVRASGSYATVTAWQKGSSGWKSQFSTTAGRVGSNGVTNGSTRRQNTYTTPSGTYTLTQGFGVQAGGTSMPYTVVNGSHWWVEDPESKYYNQMHSASGADFPLTEQGARGSERLVDHPTQYAKALVIDYNRWPAVPGRGAGIFLHVNGSGATAGCVSVPRATMDRIMGWISPSAHPRIAIG
ncbi:L,D-transpeptidase [Streptomyces sp. B1I3]|uniref:L,D-transpeptidase family protein n=1 Tax=Streptomyces sp. B1I3 TaxID=3042264 RepID=UPI00277DA232|nr:L,D-transpeptidase family protein [Streptomyces sp. B1I3]MDQ0794593.1 L,D-peptidoglycan transpeptidase YkuD (ErfK/YbiS/YcfS/YnhG family) [Streptomyces sp. B1I3]